MKWLAPVLSFLLATAMADAKSLLREHAQVLRRVAASLGVARCRDNASRDQVKEMADAVMAAGSLVGEERAEAEAAWVGYRDSFPGWLQEPVVGEEPEQNTTEKTKRWAVKSAQFTYNSKSGDWCSKDVGVLRALFDRLVAFMQVALAPFKPKGMSATLEESKRSGEHVHAHVFFHLAEQYQRHNLDAFIFDGVQPHCEPNRASGSAYKGSVDRAHYYVIVDKIGTLFNYTDYPPFESYGVEGWWIDNWLKQGKLTRSTYLSIAARITVGFQRRLTDVRAAERFEREV